MDDVARAVRAGAGGFIDIDLEPGEAVDAIKTLCEDGTWFKPEQVVDVLREVADDLDVTSTDRRSRLTTVVLGLIPLAGVLAGLLSLLWRRYLGQIGVRPVDLAIDPGSRVVDVVFSLLTLIGFFGPFLFIGTWMPERGPFLRELMQAGLPLAIYGNDWQKAPEWPDLRRAWQGPAIYGDDYLKAIQLAKVSLGLGQHRQRSRAEVSSMRERLGEAGKLSDSSHTRGRFHWQVAKNLCQAQSQAEKSFMRKHLSLKATEQEQRMVGMLRGSAFDQVLHHPVGRP